MSGRDATSVRHKQNRFGSNHGMGIRGPSKRGIRYMSILRNVMGLPPDRRPIFATSLISQPVMFARSSMWPAMGVQSWGGPLSWKVQESHSTCMVPRFGWTDVPRRISCRIMRYGKLVHTGARCTISTVSAVPSNGGLIWKDCGYSNGLSAGMSAIAHHHSIMCTGTFQGSCMPVLKMYVSRSIGNGIPNACHSNTRFLPRNRPDTVHCQTK